MDQKILIPTSAAEVVEQVKVTSKIIPHGGGTKPYLWRSDESPTLMDMKGVSGIVEYQSSEYTITVKAGTRLSTVVETLAENRQYLPFDPPLAEKGATIGGTVAAGLSGPGAYRYGPLKDFIIGVRFVDGLGNLVRGGGKVVKNAAGFDFPKVFNGSMGRLGILTEVSFKVFPEPQSYVTLQTTCESLKEGLKILPTLKGFDLEGVELDSKLNLLLRLSYQEATMKERKSGLEALIGKPLTMTLGDTERTAWRQIKSFDWCAESECLFKTAVHPESANRFIADLDTEHWNYHLTNGGKTLYLSGKKPTDHRSFDTLLKEHGLTSLQLKGSESHRPLIGNTRSLNFINRIQAALDPNGIFLPF